MAGLSGRRFNAFRTMYGSLSALRTSFLFSQIRLTDCFDSNQLIISSETLLKIVEGLGGVMTTIFMYPCGSLKSVQAEGRTW
jgi:hypothetical protein